MRPIWLAIIGSSIAASVAAQDEVRPGARPGSEPVPEISDVVTPESEKEAGLTILPLSTLPSPRPDGLLDSHAYRLALSAALKEDWDLAQALAANGDPVSEALIEWRRLRAGIGTFDEYRAFLAAHPDWPGLDRVRLRGERAVPRDAVPDQVVAYFDEAAPQTGQGALRLAAAWAELGDPAQADDTIATAWTTLQMRVAEEAEILANFPDIVEPLHEARLNMLLWEKDYEGALRAKGRVDEDIATLADARIALQREQKGVDASLAKVSDRLKGDAGLAHDRAIWNIENRKRDAAIDLILKQSTGAASLGRPQAWANWRRILARQTMRAGDGERAYALASSHYIDHTTTFYGYADLEWLSGYLALQYLDDPEQALIHFQRFTAAVYTPISLGRAYYWQGRAFEALGDAEAATAAYREGGAHQSSFYGQLAAEKAGIETDPSFTGASLVDWRSSALAGNEMLQAALLNYNAGQSWEAIRFLSHLADTIPAGQLPALAAFAHDLGDPYVAVRVAKRSVRRGFIAMDTYFPLVDLGIDLPVEAALALSIARRESEFHIGAVSPAGARGLMQVMPATAKTVARGLDLPYAQSKLTTDPVFNATLGSAYLAQLIEEFGPNYALVAAGYNAGPGRPRRWVEEYGDPRDAEVDAVDWVEHIPFRETRNYVMRVMESVPIYRARLTGEVVPLTTSTDLKRQ